MAAYDFSPGSLVRAREREWVVIPSDDPDMLMLRPLGAGEHESTGIYLPLARTLRESINSAIFPPPSPTTTGDALAGALLRDATRLTFRSGAGPFRSLGRISVRPRPYQVVPLLMALRLDPIRLLIADDVGIGKTIEAGLIAREMLDRGEAKRLTVLCPPHLCDQWQRELSEKFALDAVVIRAGTLSTLERSLPQGTGNLYAAFKVSIVSMDFAKSERRRASFLQGCGDMVIVDEAHTASQGGKSVAAQQRHALLQQVAADPARHVLLLTATPHSGVQTAFQSLLGLLNPRFNEWGDDTGNESQRRVLQRYFVQRRRRDVQEWSGVDTPFPVRISTEVHYSLQHSPLYRELFDDIYAFARVVVSRVEGSQTKWQQRVRYWTALALLRCVMSSPAAAETALRTRMERLEPEGEGATEVFADYVLDVEEREVPQDFDPTVVIQEGSAILRDTERRTLREFAQRAAALKGERDPKLIQAIDHIAKLLRDGYHPVVFCRYIATAEYVRDELLRRLQSLWKGLHVVAVTGQMGDDEREARVRELAESSVRVLVATDCLSEGVNLQDAFDAVVHYDLPWNPNRLEQREGRVDRYGQRRDEVRALLLFGQDNPIDILVLDVLIRKARTIRDQLGVIVPVPMDSESLMSAVVRSMFVDTPAARQLSLFDTVPDVMPLEEVEVQWDRAVAREQQTRSRYAQHAIHPDEVMRELTETDAALGDAETVERFVLNACQRLNAPLVAARQDGLPVYRLPFAQLPPVVQERCKPLFATGRKGEVPATVTIAFTTLTPEGVPLIGRLHPLVESLADHLLALAFDPSHTTPPAARSGAIRTDAVTVRTTLLLVRCRYLLTAPGQSTPQLSEELLVLGVTGNPDVGFTWLEPERAAQLLNSVEPRGNLSPDFRRGTLEEVLGWTDQWAPYLSDHLRQRAESLAAAHTRVRQVIKQKGDLQVKAHLPADILGVYVLLPLPRGIPG